MDYVVAVVNSEPITNQEVISRMQRLVPQLAMQGRPARPRAELARERGAFPLFNADLYLSAGNFASRLPQPLKERIRQHGLRNSHLLSIAPTGTISLAFADNASNGIEPPFSWTYTRRKRMADGSWKGYAVEDYAWRLYRHLGGETNQLPQSFVTALEISAQAHEEMVAAVAPYIDTSISKTVNVPSATWPTPNTLLARLLRCVWPWKKWQLKISFAMNFAT